MSKLIIMRGLPASGKSTKAKELIRESGNAVRVNKDLLRTMLHCDKWSGKNEAITMEAEEALATILLKVHQNHTVIVDDTNLNPKTYMRWIELAMNIGATYETMDFFAVPVEECIERDAKREKKVGKSVIMNMARQYKLYHSELQDVIVDIDGTLAEISHRRHFVEGEKKDWKSFFDAMSDDVPRDEIVDQVVQLSEQYNIVLVSGRPENYRKETEAWLERYNIPYQTLIMRKANDTRQDYEVKKDILNTYFVKDNVHLVIDDRPQVIRMWKENGLQVMDVGDGVEF